MVSGTAVQAGDLRRVNDRQRPMMGSKSVALRRRGTGTVGKLITQNHAVEEDELDLTSELKAMATVFGSAASRPKLHKRSSSRRSVTSTQGSIASGPPSIGTPLSSLSFHTARSSASYFTASLEILEDRKDWLLDVTQSNNIKPSVQKSADRWLQALQTLKHLELENVEDHKKLKAEHLHYVGEVMRRSENVRAAIQARVLAQGPVFSSKWLKFLDSRGMLTNELDWSGRGEHVEFDKQDDDNIPLRYEKALGRGAFASVDCVRCRRIRLARKTIECPGLLRRKKAILEVEILQKLRHSHIIRVVGTYTAEKFLFILMYPVAEWNLEDFMEEVATRNSSPKAAVWDKLSAQASVGFEAIATFFACISNATSFIHQHNIRHMDFKPQNLLVRATDRSRSIESTNLKIYIADFGIARAYKTAADSVTGSLTAFTPLYAPPEVVEQEDRDFSCDVFSIGCIFMEMLATMFSSSDHDERERLSTSRRVSYGHGERPSYPYHSNIGNVLNWYSGVRESSHSVDFRRQALEKLGDPFLDLLPKMLDPERTQRPKALDLKSATRALQCSQCHVGPEPFEAAELTVTS